MKEFKVGDKVLCLDAGTTANKLTTGKIYTVAQLDENCVYVRNDLGQEEKYFEERFQLVAPELTIEPSRTEVKLSFGCGLEMTIDLSQPLALDLACAALAAYAKAAKQ